MASIAFPTTLKAVPIILIGVIIFVSNPILVPALLPRTEKLLIASAIGPITVVTAKATAAIPPTTATAPTATFVKVDDSSGFALDHADTLSITAPIFPRKIFKGGSKTDPMLIPSSAILFLKRIILLAVVSALALYSSFIDPAYLVASPTFFKFSSKAPILVSRGAIALKDSLPNKVASIAPCFSFGKALIKSRIFNVVPSASFCIDLATSSESNPKSIIALRCDFVADSPAINASIIFLMPVAAISSCTPIPRIVAPRAAIDPDAKPPTSPNGPIR